MTLENLSSEVRALRPEAQATASKLGGKAAPVLIPLADDPDPQIRAQALLCLTISGGERISEVGLRKMKDPDDQVVVQALQLLSKHPPFGHEKELVELFQKPPAPGIREEIPLIAGRMPLHLNPVPWVEFWQKENDPVVKEALMVALARIGHPQARQQFVQRVLEAKGNNIIHWLERCQYMEDRWIVPSLLPLLDRKEVVYELAPDSKNKWPLRTCDFAVRTIVALAPARTSFETDRPSQFTDAELEEVRKLTR
jgi:hypothetical protein